MLTKEVLSKDYISIDKNETVSRLIGCLIIKNQRAAVVFDNKKYFGITTKRLLLKTKFDPAKLKVAKVTAKAPALTGEEDISEAARLLYTSDSPILPIIAKKGVIGIVRNIDLINQLKNTKLKNKKIKELMSLKPITVKENDRTGKAIEIMREKKVSRLPIVDNKGELFSITSVTDILQQYHLRQQGKSERGSRDASNNFFKQGKGFAGTRTDLHAYPIKNLTSPITITGKESDSVSNVINKMNEFNISSLVIIKDKKPVGIVTVRDLLKLFMKEKITF